MISRVMTKVGKLKSPNIIAVSLRNCPEEVMSI